MVLIQCKQEIWEAKALVWVMDKIDTNYELKILLFGIFSQAGREYIKQHMKQ